MAQIAPFPGIHYNPSRVTLDNVIAPPYDVLSPAHQEALYAQDPHNIVRLILNKEEHGDNETTNRYTRAAAFLQQSLSDGILAQDAEPGLYEYIQRFPHPLQPEECIERRALLVALRLEPYENGVVLPHEETHPKAKTDRLLLMRATQSNPEPIYGLYEDPDQTVAKSLIAAREGQEPFLTASVSTPNGPEQHLVYRHTDSSLIGALEAFFGPRRVWIADGHHRYETAMNFMQEKEENKRRRGEENSKALLSERTEASDYLLIGLSAFEEPGLVVLPTHRLIRNVREARMESLALQLDRFFEVRSLATDEARRWLAEQVTGQHRFVLVSPRATYALTLRDNALLNEAMDSSHCEAWRHLDVSILQALFLDRTLGIGWKELAHTQDLAYTRDADEAVDLVRRGEFQIACLLQNPSVTEVRDVAAAGDKMPQKSTFFYPKLWSGLILRSLR